MKLFILSSDSNFEKNQLFKGKKCQKLPRVLFGDENEKCLKR